MPNPSVPAAALGLPMPSPDLAAIMRVAHAFAREMPKRLPYADRLATALRRAWAASKASTLATLRSFIASHVERLLAVLDIIDGDADLEDGADDESYLAGASAPAPLADVDLEDDPGEWDVSDASDVADFDGLWEQGHLFGRGLRSHPDDVEAARCAAAQAKAISARFDRRAA